MKAECLRYRIFDSSCCVGRRKGLGGAGRCARTTCVVQILADDSSYSVLVLWFSITTSLVAFNLPGLGNVQSLDRLISCEKLFERVQGLLCGMSTLHGGYLTPAGSSRPTRRRAREVSVNEAYPLPLNLHNAKASCSLPKSLSSEWDWRLLSHYCPYPQYMAHTDLPRRYS